MSEYYIEEDTCELCGSPVLIVLKRDRTAQGTLLPWIVQRIRCLNGCVGRGVLNPASISRGA